MWNMRFNDLPPPSRSPRPARATVLAALAVIGLLQTPTATACEYAADRCHYLFNVEREGFYVVSAALPPAGQEGMFTLSLTPSSWRVLPGRSAMIGTIHSGSVLKEDGEVPGFAAFWVECTQPIEVIVHDYRGGLDTVDFRLLDSSSHRQILFSIQATIGQPFQTPVLEGGAFSVAEVYSDPEQGRGRFGLSLTSGNPAACGLDGGFHAGGWLDVETGDPPEGFIAAWLTTGTFELSQHYGSQFGTLGASRPDLAIRYLNASGLYEPFWSSPAIVKLNEDGTEAEAAVLSAEGDIAVYLAAPARTEGSNYYERQLLRHDLIADQVESVFDYADMLDPFDPCSGGPRDFQVSDGGRYIAYIRGRMCPWPAGPKWASFSASSYDFETGITELVRDLGSGYFDVDLSAADDVPLLASRSNGFWENEVNVELYDMETGQAQPLDLWGLTAYDVSLDSDGGLMAFSDSSWPGKIYVIDTRTGRLHFASGTRAGIEPGACGKPAISANGRFTAFRCGWMNEISLYVYDLSTGYADKIISAPWAKALGYGRGDLSAPQLSGDGRILVFSAPVPLDSLDPQAPSGIYLMLLRPTAGGIVADSGALLLTAGADGSSYDPHISADGRFITFTSQARNLTDDIVTTKTNVFLYREPSRVVRLPGDW